LSNELGLTGLADEVVATFAQDDPVTVSIGTHDARPVRNFLWAGSDCTPCRQTNNGPGDAMGGNVQPRRNAAE